MWYVETWKTASHARPPRSTDQQAVTHTARSVCVDNTEEYRARLVRNGTPAGRTQSEPAFNHLQRDAHVSVAACYKVANLGPKCLASGRCQRLASLTH